MPFVSFSDNLLYDNHNSKFCDGAQNMLNFGLGAVIPVYFAVVNIL